VKLFDYLPRFSSRRPFVFVAAFFIAGILLGDAVWGGGLPIAAAAAVLAILVVLLGVVASGRLGRAVLAALIVWLGVVAVNLFRARVLREGSFSALVAPGQECRIEGVILDEPESKESEGLFGQPEAHVYRFHLRVTGVELEGRTQPASGKAVVTVSRDGELGVGYGDRVALWGTVRAPEPARNPGGFDYRTYLERKGIRRLIRVGTRDEVERLGGGGSPVWRFVYGARDRFEHALERGRMSEEDRTFLKAVLLGKRRAVSEELEDALLNTNTLHILAISGLHVGIIALAVRRALRACFLPRWAASVITLVVVALYAAMTGGRPSVVRASVMMGVFLLAPVVRREADALNSLALAAVVILVVRPLDVYAAGFQLSFVAAGVIVLLAPRLIEWAAARWHLRPEPGVEVADWRVAVNGVALAGVQLLAVTISAYIAVAPLTAYYFNRFAPLSFIPNVAVVALMGIIVPLGLVAAVAGQVSSLVAAGLNTVNGVLIGALRHVVVLTSNVHLVHVNVRSAPLLVLCAYYAVLVAVGFAHGASRTIRVALAATLAAVGAVAIWSPAAPAPDATEITILDVGKGEAIFVRTRQGRRILIDGGMVVGGDPGRWSIMPFLRSRGYNRLDTVVLTHYDADHYGGLAHVVKRMAVGRLVVRGGPESRKADRADELMRIVERRGIPVERLGAGQRLTPPGDTPIVALAPEATLPDTVNENNASIVLRVGGGPGVLLAADIEAETEQRLVEARAGGLAAAVLKVPHQGSKRSSTPEFLDAVQPALAIITADRYKIHPHPAPEIVERYEARGVKVLRTDYHGAIVVLLTDGGFRAWTMLRAPEKAPAD
jgi:competence protein ComEC